MRDKGGVAFGSDFGEVIRSSIGQNIADVRVARGMTQRELADRVNITMRHLTSIEAGTGNPTINVLIRIAAELSVEFAEIAPKRRSSGQRLLSVPRRDLDALIRIAEQAKRERGKTEDEPRGGNGGSTAPRGRRSSSRGSGARARE